MGLLFELWLVNCNGFEPKPMDWSQAEFRYSHDGPWGETVLAPTMRHAFHPAGLQVAQPDWDYMPSMLLPGRP